MLQFTHKRPTVTNEYVQMFNNYKTIVMLILLLYPV